jgi:hypothetical protein
MEVVRNRIDTVWAAVDTGVTLYTGQVVTRMSTTEGIATSGLQNIVAAAGASDTTNRIIPLGIVEATNNFNKTYSSTYGGAEYITGVNTPALQNARDFRGVEGRYPKNDPRAFVQIALIGPNTVIKSRLYASTFGTAPTVYTATAVNGTVGLGFTTAALAATPTAYNHSWCARTGANAGITREAYDASTTAHTFYIYWPFTNVIGDTFAFAALKEFGTCKAQIDALGMFVDSSADYASNYYYINVLKLDLRKAGEEYVEFTFTADQFAPHRA